MDTREAAGEMGVGVVHLRRVAKKLGIGCNNGRGWWFTDADIEALRQRPQHDANALAEMSHARHLAASPPHCPRCEILTPNGQLCDDCNFELAHGHYPIANELTGILE